MQECAPIIILGPLNDTILTTCPPNIKCRISPECRHASLSSLLALQAILEYIVNEPSMMENDGELTEIKYTLLLKHSMSDISKML